MNHSMALDIIGWILVAATFILLALQWTYLRRERAKCRKYPFFKFRDEVIWGLIQDGNDSDSLALYKSANFVIDKLNHFDFVFYNLAIQNLCKQLLEIKMGDWDALKRFFDKPLSPAEMKSMELVRLLLFSARQNSLLMRAAMSKIGFGLLFRFHFMSALGKVSKRADAIGFCSFVARYA